MRAISAAIGASLVLAMATASSAQQAAPPATAGPQQAAVSPQSAAPPNSAAQPAPVAAVEDQQTDVFDVLKRLFRKVPSATAPAKLWNYRDRILAVMPSLGYKPSSGFIVGVSANVAVFFGDPKTTRMSSAVMGATVSTKKQTSLQFKYLATSADDRIRVEGDNRFQWLSQDTYGLGSEAALTAEPVNAKFHYIRIFETAQYRLLGDLFGGFGVHYASHTSTKPGEGAEAAWDTSPYAEYSRQHGFDLEAQTSTGISVNLLADTRDHPINASRGWLASVSYRPFFKDVFGSDSAWQEVLFDVRTFVKTRKDGRQKVAVWLYGDIVAAGVPPYFDLPALGMDTYGRSGRGYGEGRFRGERIIYGEVEYRATLTRNGLLGMVVFANATTMASAQAGETLFDEYSPAAGVGLRLLLSKRSKTNICVDMAWGKNGSKGLYMALQEAF